jgi:hypothetical protein
MEWNDPRKKEEKRERKMEWNDPRKKEEKKHEKWNGMTQERMEIGGRFLRKKIELCPVLKTRKL